MTIDLGDDVERIIGADLRSVFAQTPEIDADMRLCRKGGERFQIIDNAAVPTVRAHAVSKVSQMIGAAVGIDQIGVCWNRLRRSNNRVNLI